jgi:hypothetical protein
MLMIHVKTENYNQDKNLAGNCCQDNNSSASHM